MTAQDVIEQIKTLPPKEKAIVVDFVHQIEGSLHPSVKVRSVDRSKLAASADQIFKRYDDVFRKLAK